MFLKRSLSHANDRFSCFSRQFLRGQSVRGPGEGTSCCQENLRRGEEARKSGRPRCYEVRKRLFSVSDFLAWVPAPRSVRSDLLRRFFSSREREVEKFRVAVSVPAGAETSFLLTYEELLPRRLGRYELSLGLRPGQLVQNLSVDVSVTEQTGISFINVLPLRTSRLLSSPAQGRSPQRLQSFARLHPLLSVFAAADADAEAPASTRVERSACCARLRYSPTLQQQSSVSSKGLHADFIVQYDVALRDLLGEVQVRTRLVF